MTNTPTPSNSVVTEAMIEAGREVAIKFGLGMPPHSDKFLSAIYLAMQSANTIGSDELVEGVVAAMKSHEVIGVAFPDSCCSVYRVQVTGAPTIVGGDHIVAEDAQAVCDALNARAALAIATPDTDRLFDAIAHGDDDHRAWLKEAIEAHFAGQPVPPLRGLGTKEARIAMLEEQIAADTDRVAVLTEALLLAKTALGFPTGKIMRPEAEARRAAFDAIDAALSQPLGSQGGEK